MKTKKSLKIKWPLFPEKEAIFASCNGEIVSEITFKIAHVLFTPTISLKHQQNSSRLANRSMGTGLKKDHQGLTGSGVFMKKRLF